MDIRYEINKQDVFVTKIDILNWGGVNVDCITVALVERLHAQLIHKRKLKWCYWDSVVEQHQPFDCGRIRLHTHVRTFDTIACSHSGIGMSRDHAGNGIGIAGRPIYPN